MNTLVKLKPNRLRHLRESLYVRGVAIVSRVTWNRIEKTLLPANSIITCSNVSNEAIYEKVNIYNKNVRRTCSVYKKVAHFEERMLYGNVKVKKDGTF